MTNELAAHQGDPCHFCGVGHDKVPPGPCIGRLKSWEQTSIDPDNAAMWRIAITEIRQLRGNLSLAEDGLANATQEIELVRAQRDSNLAKEVETVSRLEAEIGVLQSRLEGSQAAAAGGEREIEQLKRNLAWQSQEIDAQVGEIQRLNDYIEGLPDEPSVQRVELREIPSAWMRGIHPISTPDGPGEWEVELEYGDDEPEGPGWVALYSKPPQIGPVREPVAAPIDYQCRKCGSSDVIPWPRAAEKSEGGQ